LINDKAATEIKEGKDHFIQPTIGH